MLEKIVEKFRSLILAGVVVLLSSVFVLQFGGPQAEGCTTSTVSTAASVRGHTIGAGDFEAAYLLSGADRYPPALAKQANLKQLVLHGLVERRLLAERARDLGFRISEEEVMRRVAKDGTIYVSMASDAPPFFGSGPRRFDFSDSNDRFSKDNLKRFIQYRLRRSVREFAQGQIEETLAHQMRELIRATVSISDTELWNAFVQEREKVTLKYLRFSPAYYGGSLSPSSADVDAWMQAHQDDLNAAYEKEKHRYTDLEKQVRTRHILIKVDPNAPEQDKSKARDRAAEILERVKAGGDFAALARQLSEDSASARQGGDLGYNSKGRMVKAFDDVQFAMKPGAVSDVVESRYGFHILRVEGIREGDVPLEEAKRELAQQAYEKETSERLARAAAQAAHAKLLQGASLAELAQTRNDAQGQAEAEEDPMAPQVRDAGPFGRSDTAIPGPFDSGSLVKAAFRLTTDEPFLDEPMQLGSDWFVVKLVERTHAKAEDFNEEERGRMLDRLLPTRERQVLKGYVKRLMQEATADKALAVNDALLTYEGVE